MPIPWLAMNTVERYATKNSSALKKMRLNAQPIPISRTREMMTFIQCLERNKNFHEDIIMKIQCYCIAGTCVFNNLAFANFVLSVCLF